MTGLSSEPASDHPDAEFGVGWLSGVTWGDGRELAGAFASYLGPVEIRDMGTRWYAESAELGAHGVVVAWHPRGRDSRPDEVMFSVPQTALDLLGVERALNLVTELRLVGVRFSRVDLYLDDLARRADPAVVMGAFQAGDVVTHLRGWDWMENGDGGATAYLGSRSSDAYLRVYRKWAESGDPTRGVRWELQARAVKAQTLAGVAVTADEPGRAFWGAVRGLVDFRACAGMVQKMRAPMLDWWAELCADADRVKLSRPQPGATMAEKMEWMHRQLGPTMAMLDQVAPRGWIDRLLAEGAERLTAKHHAMLAEYQVNGA